MSIEKPKVAIIGLGFGAEFIPIYQRHPDTETVALCQRNEENLNKDEDEEEEGREESKEPKKEK